LISPASLKVTLARKCNLFETKAIFYPHKVWLVEDSQVLSTARLEAFKAPVTLVITGDLRIDETVSPAMLEAQISGVYNYGHVSASSAQLAVLTAKPGSNEGQFTDLDKSVKPDEAKDSDWIGNANNLIL
jgi:hypothetical protein